MKGDELPAKTPTTKTTTKNRMESKEGAFCSRPSGGRDCPESNTCQRRPDQLVEGDVATHVPPRPRLALILAGDRDHSGRLAVPFPHTRPAGGVPGPPTHPAYSSDSNRRADLTDEWQNDCGHDQQNGPHEDRSDPGPAAEDAVAEGEEHDHRDDRDGPPAKVSTTASTATATPETSRGSVPSAPHARPAQTPATTEALPPIP